MTVRTTRPNRECIIPLDKFRKHFTANNKKCKWGTPLARFK